MPPSPPPSLAPGEVALWLVRPEEVTAERWRELEGWLSPDETARAGRFHFERDRRLFQLGRGLAREQLGRWLDEAPGALRFEEGPHGKPHLGSPWASAAPSFNVSHTAGLVALALATVPVGVDVEAFERLGSPLELAERLFSPEEQAVLRGHPPAAQRDYFCQVWTLKEAYVKARGEGLSLPLCQVQCVLEPGERARLRFALGFDDRTEAWQLQALRPGPRHYAAVALRAGGETPLRCRLQP